MKNAIKKVKETMHEKREYIAFAVLTVGACCLFARAGYNAGIKRCSKVMSEKFDPIISRNDLDILSIGVKRGADYVTSTCFERKDMIPLKELAKDVATFAEGAIDENTPVMAYTILFKRES